LREILARLVFALAPLRVAARDANTQITPHYRGRRSTLVVARSVVLGFAAVVATAALAIVVDIIWFLSTAKREPDMSYGIDIVSLVRSLLTPVDLTAGVVIFALMFLLSMRWSAR
jgi:hypothetical protein